MRIISARIIFTAAIVLFLGLLVVNKAMVRAHAASPGAVSCRAEASSVRQASLKSGYSELGAAAQYENVLARCLING